MRECSRCWLYDKVTSQGEAKGRRQARKEKGEMEGERKEKGEKEGERRKTRESRGRRKKKKKRKKTKKETKKLVVPIVSSKLGHVKNKK